VNPGFCDKMEVTRVPPETPSRTTGWELLVYKIRITLLVYQRSARNASDCQVICLVPFIIVRLLIAHRWLLNMQKSFVLETEKG